MPSPVYSQELEVTRQAFPIPPVAITIDFALKTMKRPFSRQYANAPETRPLSVKSRVTVHLRHAPVVQKFSTAHGVAKMSFPTIGGVYVGHGRGDATFRHDSVSFSKEGFADHPNRGALRKRFDSRTQSCAARPNDQNIVLARLVVGSHRSLRSRKAPQATIRT